MTAYENVQRLLASDDDTDRQTLAAVTGDDERTLRDDLAELLDELAPKPSRVSIQELRAELHAGIDALVVSVELDSLDAELMRDAIIDALRIYDDGQHKAAERVKIYETLGTADDLTARRIRDIEMAQAAATMTERLRALHSHHIETRPLTEAELRQVGL